MTSEKSAHLLDENFYTTHITFTGCAQIQKLMKSLKWLNLSYFTFERIYLDGSHLRLSNAREWTEYYYRNQLYGLAIFEQTPQLFNDGIVFWSRLNYEPIYAAKAKFNIKQGFTISHNQLQYYNFYHFGSHLDKQLDEASILGYQSDIEQFIAIFHKQCAQLVKEAEKNRILLPSKSQLPHHQSSPIKSHRQETPITPKRFYLGADFNHSYLTTKELEILIHLYTGKRIVHIAKTLFVAKKTVESHIHHIKLKLGCSTLFEVGAIMHHLGIYKLAHKVTLIHKKST